EAAEDRREKRRARLANRFTGGESGVLTGADVGMMVDRLPLRLRQGQPLNRIRKHRRCGPERDRREHCRPLTSDHDRTSLRPWTITYAAGTITTVRTTDTIRPPTIARASGA